jgi:hypothetical protein
MQIEIYASSSADTDRAIALGRAVRKDLAHSSDEVWVMLREADNSLVVGGIANGDDLDI